MLKKILGMTILFSAPIWSMDCPSTIEGAQLYLSIDNQTHLKIQSALSCGTKPNFPQKFMDADVEIWKKGKKIGTFYSRRVTYSDKTQMLVLNQALLQKDSKKTILEDARQYVIDIKKDSITSQNKLVHF